MSGNGSVDRIDPAVSQLSRVLRFTAAAAEAHAQQLDTQTAELPLAEKLQLLALVRPAALKVIDRLVDRLLVIQK